MTDFGKKVLTIAILAIVAVGALIFFIMQTPQEQVESEPHQQIELAQIPEGWYQHNLGESQIILTRSPELPDVGATEGYAYGEQISISTGIFDGDLNNREDWYYIRWVFEDEALVRNWSWTAVGGLDALRVESEAAGASGGQLRYFIFAGDQFHVLSLYPFETSEHAEQFKQLVHEYASGLLATEKGGESDGLFTPTEEEKRIMLQDNCMREIPLRSVDDATNNTDGTVTMRWWDGELQQNMELTVPYEPETDFAGCSESIKTFLKQIIR